MSSAAKVLIGALVIVNVGLISMLLFREQSIVPASAQPVDPRMERAPLPVVPATVEPVTIEPTALLPTSEPWPEEAAAPTSRPEPARVEPEPRPVETSRPEPLRRAQPRRPQPEPPAPEPVTQIADLTPVLPPIAPEPAPVPVPVQPPPPTVLTLPAGTNLAIRLDIGLHSRQVRRGDRFEASLAEDLEADGRVLAYAGAPVVGQVVDVREAGRVKGREEMRLTLVELVLEDEYRPISASILTLTAENDKKRDATVVSATTVMGAIIGGIAKGGKGAATGAAAGAAAGAGVVLSTRGRAVELAAGERLDFTLEDQESPGVARR